MENEFYRAIFKYIAYQREILRLFAVAPGGYHIPYKTLEDLKKDTPIVMYQRPDDKEPAWQEQQ